MKLIYYIIYIFLIPNIIPLSAQVTPLSDTLPVKIPDTIVNFSRMLRIPGADSTATDFTGQISQEVTLPDRGYRLSKDSLEADVIYGAKDSSYTDLVNNVVHLWGSAFLEYTSFKVKAGYIVLKFDENVVEAFAVKGPDGKLREKPEFTDGTNKFTYQEMRYNFKTRKGLVQKAQTKEGEFTLFGDRTKMILKGADSLQVDDIVNNKVAIISTCDHDPPHYGIRTNKMKFVPGKVAVMSMAQLEFAGVPSPVVLPFGFFPLIKGKSSGLIFPASYDYNEQFGLGFREVGYYFPISNSVDLRITGDIYTRGTHALRINTTYKKRYGYSGNFRLGYTNNIIDDLRTGGKQSSRSFNIALTHNQDSKAHPFRRMGGSINLQTNRYDQRTFENPVATFTNTITSNFSFSHDMPGTPFSFNAEFRHSQNTQTRLVDITLPNISLRMNTINPFRKKNATKERWTDNIAVSYNSELRNYVQTTDTTLFTAETLRNFQTGMSHRGNVSTNFRILRYINVAPSINYEEFWLLKKYQESFDPTLIINFDTIRTGDGEIVRSDTTFGSVQKAFVNEFNALRRFNTGISLNTQIFGTQKFSKGWLRGLRHVMKPAINFVYSPANADRYQALVDTDARPEFNRERVYNPFQQGPFGTLTGGQEQMALNFNILNVFEAKYFSKKDTTEKIIRLFDNINMSGGYNFAADSFHWSDLRITGNTRVLKGLTNFVFSMAYSPYVHINNRRINQTVWEAKNRLLEFRDFNGQFSTGFSFRQVRDFFRGGNSAEKEQPLGNRGDAGTAPSATSRPKIKQISLADWFENFNIQHAYNFQIRNQNGRDTFIVTSHSVNISGSVPLTKNWNMNIGSIGYDIQRKELLYPFFTFSRDLHCWQMNFTWAPTTGVYSFYIGVKSTALSFLKYDFNQRNAQALFTGRRF